MKYHYAQTKGICPLCKEFMFYPSPYGNPENELIATADHIVPLEEGGSNYLENLRVICNECNNILDNPDHPKRGKQIMKVLAQSIQ